MRIQLAVLPVSFYIPGSIAGPPALASNAQIDNYFAMQVRDGLQRYVEVVTMGGFKIDSYKILPQISLKAQFLYEEAEKPGSIANCYKIIDKYANKVDWKPFTHVMIISNFLHSNSAAGFFDIYFFPKIWFPAWQAFITNLNWVLPMRYMYCTDFYRSNLPTNVIRQHEFLHSIGFEHIYNRKGEKITGHQYCALGYGNSLSAANLYTGCYINKNNKTLIDTLIKQNRILQIKKMPITDGYIEHDVIALDQEHLQPNDARRAGFPFLVVVLPTKTDKKTYFIEYRRDRSYPMSFDINLPYNFAIVVHSHDPTKNYEEQFIFEGAEELLIGGQNNLIKKVFITPKGADFGIIVSDIKNNAKFITVQICGKIYLSKNIF